jgi:lysyl-tRNA synthetase class 2
MSTETKTAQREGENTETEAIDEYQERLEKLRKLREININPYPAEANRTHTTAEVLEQFAQIEAAGTEITLTGRLRSKRVHGNLSFCELMDASGKLQIALSKKELSETYKPFVKLIDAGDFVQVTGKLFITKAGQQTLMVSNWQLLTKALRPIPTEHFGLRGDDARYRKRYLDLLLQPELREMFVRKAKFWQVIRDFMEARDFIEVHTPTLETTTGGAEARPFVTHHNDYDMDVYLRISAGELWQKRLMAAGFEKTYEIARVWRNEGTSINHLQEFTNIEFYWAYADYRDGMRFTQELYRQIAQKVYGTTKFTAREHTFDLADDWREIDYSEEIIAQTSIDITSATADEIRAKLDELSVKYDATTRERLVDNLWKYCRKSIAGPAFVIGYPVFMAPLAKRNPNNLDQVEQFQIILGGAEIGKGYSELNDPIDQRERFTKQQELLNAGDDEAMMTDDDFIEMLEHGMPPTFGFGAGERLFAFFENKTLRETTLFPLMKPKE